MIPRLVSITDFMDASEVEAMLRVFVDAGGPDAGLRLATGVMTSRRVLRGLSSNFSSAPPQPRQISHILSSPCHNTYHVLHYADYRGETTIRDLALAAARGGCFLDALQLNMRWPDPDTVKAFRRRHPNIDIILQIGRDAMKDCGDDPQAVAQRLMDYGDAVAGVLLDRSMGAGKPMDPYLLMRYAEVIAYALPNCAILFAGGLGPDTLHLLEPIFEKMPGTVRGIDAQGDLHFDRSPFQPVNWDRAALYVRRAIPLFEKHPVETVC